MNKSGDLIREGKRTAGNFTTMRVGSYAFPRQVRDKNILITHCQLI